MFTGFKLSTDYDFEKYGETGNKIFEGHKTEVINELKAFTHSNGRLNGSKMQSNWFPQIEADIFISHSHTDHKQAVGLAGWLMEEFGLVAFIDSCIWGNSRDLLKIIDDTYCLNTDKNTYNYDKRNYSTSHIYLMLSTALTKMIDNTECIFLLNTPNSISTVEVMEQTMSPWIYHEIAMMNLVKKRSLEEHRLEPIKKTLFEAKSLSIMYDVDLGHLHDINQDDLNDWNEKHARGQYALDTLYKNKKLIEYAF
ncbi:MULTISPECIES: hypothetical protein [Bacillus cereus group]|uniref:hypothetical protein n=1 Tax=Bacillus cereus group TaxID=86661 RepID=UPI0008B79EC6|nr:MULTISPECIES: hypothetical protein [Bacillus cereus group]PEM52044.1 hypothetical protein CN618_10080 [Bacillus wiedmannii]SEJ69553.1 hypothetical protein SAMN04487780_11317 [Bacillus thuringiensis]